MGEALAEVGVPGVEVRVEVDEGERPVPPGGRPQQRQGDGVVAADRHQPPAARQERVGRGLNLADRLLGAEGRAGDVTGVDHLGQREGQGIECRVVGAQEARALPDRRRAEAGARPVARAAVEGDADHGDVPARHLGDRRQAGEGADAGEARDRSGVGRSDGLGSAVHQSSMAWYTSARSWARKG